MEDAYPTNVGWHGWGVIRERIIDTPGSCMVTCSRAFARVFVMPETSPQSFARLAGLLLDIGSAENEEALLREGVSGARDVIGLDRVGIWKYDADARMMLGTFGTDEAGGLRDEREAAYSIAPDSGDYPSQDVKEQLRDLVEESKRERKPAFRSLEGS